MTTGTVKWFNVQKGYGFIAPDDGGKDAFVHISAVERSGIGDLHEGQKVGFELVSDRQERQDVGRQSQGFGLIATSAALEFPSLPTSSIASSKPTTDVLAAEHVRMREHDGRGASAYSGRVETPDRSRICANSISWSMSLSEKWIHFSGVL